VPSLVVALRHLLVLGGAETRSCFADYYFACHNFFDG